MKIKGWFSLERHSSPHAVAHTAWWVTPLIEERYMNQRDLVFLPSESHRISSECSWFPPIITIATINLSLIKEGFFGKTGGCMWAEDESNRTCHQISLVHTMANHLFRYGNLGLYLGFFSFLSFTMAVLHKFKNTSHITQSLHLSFSKLWPPVGTYPRSTELSHRLRIA